MVSKTDARPQIKPAGKPAAPAKPEPLKTPVNVAVLLMSGGQHDFIIHRQGCPVYKTQKPKSQYAGIKEDYIIEEVMNQREVIGEVWDDQIRETWAEDPKLKDKDYATASWAWLAKMGYVHSVSFHKCLDGLPQQAKTAPKAASTKKQAKNELATLVAEAAGQMVADLLDANLADDGPLAQRAALVTSGFASDDDIRQCVAQWLHGMPVYRERFLAVLPRPDRSDWREETDAAVAAAQAQDKAAATTSDEQKEQTGE